MSFIQAVKTRHEYSSVIVNAKFVQNEYSLPCLICLIFLKGLIFRSSTRKQPQKIKCRFWNCPKYLDISNLSRRFGYLKEMNRIGKTLKKNLCGDLKVSENQKQYHRTIDMDQSLDLLLGNIKRSTLSGCWLTCRRCFKWRCCFRCHCRCWCCGADFLGWM